MRLTEKVALITGAGRGIGRAIAQAFAAEGATLALVARTRDQVDTVAGQLETKSAGVLPLCADISRAEDVARIVRDTIGSFGRIDVLVNNAGIFVYKSFLEWSEDDFDRTMAINAKGAFLLCQKVLPYMMQERAGKVINISSIHGKVGDVNVAGHCVSKFGLLGLTQALAREFKSHNINVNAICPGAVDTETDESQSLHALSPLDNKVTPEDVARVAVFLAGHESNAISGAALDVLGGTNVVIA